MARKWSSPPSGVSTVTTVSSGSKLVLLTTTPGNEIITVENLFASPPTIGGTAAGAATFTNLTASGAATLQSTLAVTGEATFSADANIIVADNAYASLVLGSATDADGMHMMWNHDLNEAILGSSKVGASLYLRGDNEVLNLTLSGASGSELATFVKDVTVGGALTLTTDLAVTHGGTGASTAADARTNLGLGTGDSPTFAGLTSTGLLDVTRTGNSTIASFTGATNPNKLYVYSDGGGVGIFGNSSESLVGANFIYLTASGSFYDTPTGTAHAFRVNGSTVLSVATTSTTIASDLTLASGSITSASGAISFGNENLSTTGTLASGNATVTGLLSVTNTANRALEINNATGNVEMFFRLGGVDAYRLGTTSTGVDFLVRDEVAGRSVIEYARSTATVNIPSSNFVVDTTTLYVDATANAVRIGTTSAAGNEILRVNGLIHSDSDSIIIDTAKTPASAAATGTQGQIAWDSSYIYVCTATNTWVRAALATW